MFKHKGLQDPMTCNEVNAILSLYQDNELDTKKKSAVRAHLKKCVDCRLEYHRLETVVQAVKNLAEVEPALNFTSLVMGRIIAREKRRWFAVPQFAYSLIFIIFFIIGVFIAVNLGNGTAQQPEEVYISGFLAESQELSLLDIQDNTFALLYNGHNGGNQDGK